MYKLRIWLGPGQDYFIKSEQVYEYGRWLENWDLVSTLELASELTIEWIQENIGDIYDIINPEMVQILQVREHAK